MLPAAARAAYRRMKPRTLRTELGSFAPRAPGARWLNRSAVLIEHVWRTREIARLASRRSSAWRCGVAWSAMARYDRKGRLRGAASVDTSRARHVDWNHN